MSRVWTDVERAIAGQQVYETMPGEEILATHFRFMVNLQCELNEARELLLTPFMEMHSTWHENLEAWLSRNSPPEAKGSE